MKVCSECNRVLSDDVEECDCGCTEFTELIIREGELNALWDKERDSETDEVDGGLC